MTDYQTFGDRLTAIRVAMGSARKPLSYRKLARTIAEETGHEVSHETLRIYDLGLRRVLLDDAVAIAKVDPKGRGLEWLAGDEMTVTATAEPVVPAQQKTAPLSFSEAVKRERTKKKRKERGA